MPTTVPPNALTTRQKVKDYLSIDDTDSDTIIDELITSATQFVQSYCGGRAFLAADYIEIKDSYRYRRSIFLNQHPANSVTKVEYRSGTPTAVVWVIYDANGYLPYLNEGYVKFYARLPEISQGLRITYNAGYLIDFTNEFDPTMHTLPEDLTLVCTEIVAKQYNTRKAIGILQETTEGQSVSYSYKARELDDMHRTILNGYKQFRIAR